MNRKGLALEIIGIIMFITILIGTIFFFISIYKGYKEYKTYQTFCEERSNFCYCSYFECVFRTNSKQSCINGNCSEVILSDDTVELCKLANKFDDKSTLFKAGCNGTN